MYRPAFCFLMFLLSCNNPEVAGNRAERILKATSAGDFRGINIGDKHNEVQMKEDANSVYSMPDELVYRISPDDKDSTWYEISYNFNENGLYDISLDVYPKDTTDVRELKNNFIAHYLKKYGDCKFYNGYCQWRAITNNGHIVTITLADSLLQSPRPRLRVNFNESITQ